jgi:endonuclease/exonuclease/phosphatase family metal-dependent hydrolase
VSRGHITVLSYNIHKGFAALGGEFLLDRIREGIRSVDADVVLLQEVTGENLRHRERIPTWPEGPQFKYLADEVWDHFAYGHNAVYDHGHHGNAVLSKFPIEEWGNVDISNHRFERRGLLWARLKAPGFKNPLWVSTVHLDLTEWGRGRQVQLLAKELKKRVDSTSPLVLGGDFNDWRERCTHSLGRSLKMEEAFSCTEGAHARTYPARMPILRLDRIYFRGLRVESCRRLDGPLWKRLSDHVPLCVTFGVG